MPVRVVIAPGYGSRTFGIRYAQLGGDLNEHALVISVEAIRLPRSESNVQVQISIIVEVGPGMRHGPSLSHELRLNSLKTRPRLLGRQRVGGRAESQAQSGEEENSAGKAISEHEASEV